ncbi:DUF2510 domain-containing protein [Streptomyces bohaiensis]|uniref:DUF2510 domain-containing protein n=1 Tax=Streptomyces bohaiensis TaxID=1431344 RepID=UPI003B80EE58
MSTTMPPGWYPDPGYAGNGPAPERWWDGTNWTGQTRETTGAEPAGPTAGPAPDDTARTAETAGAGDGAARRRRAALVAVGAAAAAAAVLAAFLVGGDDPAPDAPAAGSEQQEDTDGEAGEDGQDGEGAPAPEFTRWTTAAVGGAQLPLPDGWTERPIDGVSVTGDEYPCPQDAERRCVVAGAFLIEGEPGTDPGEAAAGDITVHTESSFSDAAYGGVTDRTEELSEDVDVAGATGHRVRHRLTTGAGTEAYAESIAFPAPDGSGATLVLRLGWNAGESGPGDELMAALVTGVRPASATSPGTDV